MVSKSVHSDPSLNSLFKRFQGAIPVFDSGIGSYGVVKEIQAALPEVPLVYLADRASFPYGKMPLPQLSDNIQNRLNWLHKTFNPPAIVLASNTPSMTILDQLRCPVPILGVFPPIEAAVKQSQSGCVAVLGTQNLVRSELVMNQIRYFSEKNKTVVPVDATVLIQSMEDFRFVTTPDQAKKEIRTVLAPVFDTHPKLDVITLSSTHLTFLKPLISACYPQLFCLDPAPEVALELKEKLQSRDPFSTRKTDSLLVLTTENRASQLTAVDFRLSMAKLGCCEPVYKVILD